MSFTDESKLIGSTIQVTSFLIYASLESTIVEADDFVIQDFSLEGWKVPLQRTFSHVKKFGNLCRTGKML